ncbi:hypothetical protein ABZX40_15315 [Streptomyces sp. NPDC004610]|uniref:hypothetical protein n=1 Tax=unclassified Streptomyces TaxID=2593676 RepID=UPI0033BC414F
MPTDTVTNRICGAPGRMPVDLVALMLAHIPDTSDPRAAVRVDLRCLLEEHPTGPHHALTWTRDAPRSGEVWAQWAHEGPDECVLVLPGCNTTTARGPGDEACILFDGHPGCHSFEYADPEHPADIYPMLWMSAEREDLERPQRRASGRQAGHSRLPAGF